MQSRLSIYFILITVLLDAMGFGLIMPVMPDLIQSVRGGDLSNAALWGGALATAFAVMQFLFGPTVGNLSDWFGRRPVLLVALFFLTVDYLVMAVAGTIWLLLLGRIIAGITSATQSTASAYMADISKPEEKAGNFGLIGAAFGVGFMLGPVLGGVMAGFGTRAPFYAAAGLAGLNFAFGLIVLPETVTDRNRRPFNWRRANPFGAFRAFGHLPGLRRIMLVYFVYGVAFFVYPAVWAYFSKLRFGWDAGMIGLSLGLFGISMAMVQALLVKPILTWIGDRGAVIFGISLDAVAFVILAFVPHGGLALALIPINALGSIAGPAMQGIMSRTAAADQQGELQGTLTSIAAVGMIIAPMLLTRIFWFFTSDAAPVYLPGAPFLLSSALLMVCLAIFVCDRKLS